MDPVKDLLHLYADAVCRQDADQWIATWSESGAWDLGHGEPVSGKGPLKTFWISSSDEFCPPIAFVALIVEKDDIGFSRSHGSPRQMLFPVLGEMIFWPFLQHLRLPLQ